MKRTKETSRDYRANCGRLYARIRIHENGAFVMVKDERDAWHTETNAFYTPSAEAAIRTLTSVYRTAFRRIEHMTFMF